MPLASSRRRFREASLPVDRYVKLGKHLAAVQTVVAAAKSVFAMALLSAATPVAPVVSALLAFAVYNANNLSDLDEDAVNRPDQARFVLRRSREIGVAAGLAAAAAVGLATATGGPLAGAVALTPVVAGVVYSVPIVPGTSRRIKDVFVANTALVAAAWAVTMAFLPATLAPDVGLRAALAVCGYFFLRTFVSVEVFNVRDVVGDRESGVATLPVCLGITGTRSVLFALDGLTIAFVVWAGSTVALSSTAVFAAVAVIALSIPLTVAMTRIRDWDHACLAKDGEYLLLGAVGLLAL